MRGEQSTICEAAKLQEGLPGDCGFPAQCNGEQSCQTGNYDLYLPFIERGLELLNPNGRLGYIAPSLWRYNEYGEGLRKLLHAGGHLDRWIDFASFQVFEEAIIYTALQFYSRTKNERVRFALAPTGEVTRIHDWDDANWYVTYKELPTNDAWIFVARPELALINKLATNCKRLDDRTVTKQIYQGLITSADRIYHLERAAKNRYRYQSRKPDGVKTKPPVEEVSIEDAIMHPIVSGQEVHRYQTPTTNTFILFPYEVDDRSARLMSAATLKRDYPLAWAYLKRFEKPLRARESNAFDDDNWYRFGRHQNIDKQEIAKILVPRLCLDLAAVNDTKGRFFIDNVDVGGIEVADGVNADGLTGLLNSTTVNFVWKRIAKPFQNGYLSANKQFVAPLPIPAAKQADIAKVVALSKKLTELYTTRRDTLVDLERRFAACDLVEKPAEWLWPSEVSSVETLLVKAPKGSNSGAKTAWAKEQRAKQIELATEDLQSRLRVGASLEVEVIKGELRLKDDGITVLEGVFVDAVEAEQIAIDWRDFVRMTRITAAVTAADFARQLRCIHRTDKAAISKQLAELDAQLAGLDKDIAANETAINNMAYTLYGLSRSEIRMIESD